MWGNTLQNIIVITSWSSQVSCVYTSWWDWITSCSVFSYTSNKQYLISQGYKEYDHKEPGLCCSKESHFSCQNAILLVLPNFHGVQDCVSYGVPMLTPDVKLLCDVNCSHYFVISFTISLTAYRVEGYKMINLTCIRHYMCSRDNISWSAICYFIHNIWVGVNEHSRF